MGNQMYISCKRFDITPIYVVYNGYVLQVKYIDHIYELTLYKNGEKYIISTISNVNTKYHDSHIVNGELMNVHINRAIVEMDDRFYLGKYEL